MMHTFFVVTLVSTLVSFILGNLVTPFLAPKYTNSVLNEYNWADVVQGVCGLVLVPSILIAVVTGPLHYLGGLS